MPRRPPGRRRRGSYLGVSTIGPAVATLPLVTTLPATAIDSTVATLNGSINPQGLATTYWFVYGTTTAYGTSSSHLSVGSGAFPMTVSLGISGLVQGTTYHFAVVGSNSAGTVQGADVTFTAEPQAVIPTLRGLPSAYATTPPQPHFAWPFTVQTLGAVVNQQDSLADVFSCVWAIEACQVGASSELPTFGRPDSTFQQTNPITGLPTDDVIQAIQNQEPRADEEAVAAAITAAESGQWTLALTTYVQATDGQPT